MSKIQTLCQAPNKSFAAFLPRFERLLYEAQLTGDRASITTLRQALNLELRRAYIYLPTPTTYTEFTASLFSLSSKIEEVAFTRRAAPAFRTQTPISTHTPRPDPDAMD